MVFVRYISGDAQIRVEFQNFRPTGQFCYLSAIRSSIQNHCFISVDP